MRTPLDGGASVTLAALEPLQVWIACDGTNVYFTDVSHGTVAKVAVGGGAVTTLASGQTSPRDIAVDVTSVYWVTGLSGGNSEILKLTPK
jgi:DNA-binding beta-propeller fold protein YncE